MTGIVGGSHSSGIFFLSYKLLSMRKTMEKKWAVKCQADTTSKFNLPILRPNIMSLPSWGHGRNGCGTFIISKLIFIISVTFWNHWNKCMYKARVETGRRILWKFSGSFQKGRIRSPDKHWCMNNLLWYESVFLNAACSFRGDFVDEEEKIANLFKVSKKSAKPSRSRPGTS